MCWCEEVLLPTGVKLQSHSSISVWKGLRSWEHHIHHKGASADKGDTAHVRKSFLITAYSQFKLYWKIFKQCWQKNFRAGLSNRLSEESQPGQPYQERVAGSIGQVGFVLPSRGKPYLLIWPGNQPVKWTGWRWWQACECVRDGAGAEVQRSSQKYK